MVKGLVSVILPVYNHSYILKESIDSILRQKYSFLELIILNDGSDDNPEKVVRTYKDSRIMYHTLDHRGLPATLNSGLERAQGEFITWTSADNIMLPEMLLVFEEEFRASPELSAVFSGYYIINSHGAIIGVNHKCEHCYTPHDFINDDDRGYKIFMQCNFGPSFLCRASACELAGGFDIDCEGIEDADYSIRIAKTGTVKWVDRLLYKYRHHESSMTGRERKGELSYDAGRKYFWDKIVKDSKIYNQVMEV